MKYYLAIDIGASSGRHIVGWTDGGKMTTDEVYRFGNGVCNANGKLTWDIKSLFDNVVEGIKAALKKYPKIESFAIDTWGVDYVLINYDEEILPCHSYRDGRTQNAIERVHGLVPFAELYSRTGIQFQPFNTVYQLCDDADSGRLDNATDFLMIPEYLTYKLTGVKSHEYTNATTTGLVNCATGEYDRDIIRRLGLPDHLFCALSKPRTVVGSLKPEIREYV
ncbi:MAG: rhamnulokinase, partial [Clostridiales bacterium]|nr:rhamnulokinase [Clostridiales bacterium]